MFEEVAELVGLAAGDIDLDNAKSLLEQGAEKLVWAIKGSENCELFDFNFECVKENVGDIMEEVKNAADDVEGALEEMKDHFQDEIWPLIKDMAGDVSEEATDIFEDIFGWIFDDKE